MIEIVILILLLAIVSTLKYTMLGYKIDKACNKSALSKVYIEVVLRNLRQDKN